MISFTETEEDALNLNETWTHEDNFWRYQFPYLFDLDTETNETEKIHLISSLDELFPKNSVENSDIENDFTTYSTNLTERENYTVSSYEEAEDNETISLTAEYFDMEPSLNLTETLSHEVQEHRTFYHTTTALNTNPVENFTSPKAITEIIGKFANESTESTVNNVKSIDFTHEKEESKDSTDTDNKSRNDLHKRISEEKYSPTQFGNRQTLYQNSTQPVDSNSNIIDETLTMKPIYNDKTPHVYVLRRSCSGSVNVEKILYPHNSSKLCTELSKNISKPLSCESYYALNYHINNKIEQMLKKIKSMKIDDPNSVLDVIKVYMDETPHTFIFVKDLCSSDSSIISVMTIIIAVTAVIIFFFFSCMLFICIKIKCKRKSTSLDLSDIPHLTLSVDDYKLAPIPRPSISFPERNRDFLNAFTNESYPPPRSDDTILSQHHFSGSVKAYDAVSGGKDVPSSQEMHTFSAKRSYGCSKDRRSPSTNDYATTDSWDHRAEHKDREREKNLGVDNPSFRRW